MHDIPAAGPAISRLRSDFVLFLEEWLGPPPAGADSPGRFIHLDGAAGSGKTTILAALEKALENPDKEAVAWVPIRIDAAELHPDPPVELSATILRRLRSHSAGFSWSTARLWVREVCCRFPSIIRNRLVLALLLLPLVALVLAVRFDVVFLGIALCLILLAATLYLSTTLSHNPAAVSRREVRAACARQPLAILVDGIDRLPETRVTDVLDALSTILGSARTVVIVTGDRFWLTSALQGHFGPALAATALRGSTLGHQMLARYFDLSLSIPTSATKDSGMKKEPRPHPADHLSTAIERSIGTNPRLERRHGLAVSALAGVYQLLGLLVPREAIATWTVIALRWPLLAEYLARQPARISHFRYDQTPSDIPDAVAPLFRTGELTALLRPGAGELALDEATLRLMVTPFADGRSAVPVA